jgi:hypothetical protein
MPAEQSFFQNVRSSFMATAPGRSFVQGVGETFGMHYERGVSMGFLGRRAPGGVFGAVPGFKARGLTFLGRAAFPLFTAHAAYTGYQEGGILGAAGGVAESALMWGAMRAGWTMLGGSVGAGLVGGVAMGYGMYRLGEAARRNERRVRGLELATDVVDRFGTMSTMRQRSLQAIQNSHLNARMALGNEALLMSTPYLR